MRRSWLVAPALAVAACGGGLGSAQVGVVEGSAFVAGKTLGNRVLNLFSAFAWVDAIQGYERGPDGNWVVRQRDRKNLQLRLLGATLDPRQDLRQKTISEVLEIAQDLSHNGFVSMLVVDFDKVVTNARLKADEPVADGPLFLVDDFQFGVGSLSQEYPQSVTSLGSDRTFIIEFSRIERAVEGAIEGTLEIEFKRKSSDPTNAVIGMMKIKFSAKMVAERIAECNDTTTWGTNLGKYDDVPECQDP